MITVKTQEEIKVLREGGKILASVLRAAADMVKPGIVANEMDALAEKLIRQAGGEPSFKNYQAGEGRTPYPASLCISINDEVVHGIQEEETLLKDGDIVGLDLGMKYKGLYTDTAITVLVGGGNEKTKRLLETTKKSLFAGIKVVRDGARIGDIGFAIQQVAEGAGFSVVKNLIGHGVGYAVHEEPEIPNYGKKGTGHILKEGMVLALEPMVNIGGDKIILADDDWTWKTKDSSLSAHFEHTIVVTKSGAEVLTSG